jgi:FSR family fosmidomycin resistance protein-like MFS transporter
MLYLLIEFIDELVFGVSAAAWPLIRDDLALSYLQIGLALSLPGILGNLIEPFMFILSDLWKRRVIMLTGGLLFTLSLILTALSHNFVLLMFSFILFNPASGMFVNLAQANLMDAAPARHEQNMARWTFAGSLGVVAGPLFLSALAWLTLGWRPAFGFLALVSALSLFFAWRRVPETGNSAENLTLRGIWDGFRGALQALGNRKILRWLILLEFSDLLLDVFYGFLPLYFVDVAGFSFAQAAASVAVWTGVGLLGDFLLIPLLERVKGLDYLRWSVLLELILFPLFLLASPPWLKLVIAGAMGFFNAGWYAILKGNLFSAMPEQSGTALALNSLSGIVGKTIPFAIGLAAQFFGLGPAMWLLLAGPIALLIGLPRTSENPVQGFGQR